MCVDFRQARHLQAGEFRKIQELEKEYVNMMLSDLGGR
jgi:hypothetical protein